LVHFFEVVPPPATGETHVIGWRSWRPSALSALDGAAACPPTPVRDVERQASP